MTTTEVKRQSKAQRITLRVLTGLASLDLAVIGVFKLAGTEPHLLQSFRQMHLVDYLPLIGIIELLLAVGLVVRQTRPFAAASLLLLLSAATAAHLAAGQSFFHAVPALVMFMITFCILHLDGRIKIAPNA
jgi:uncharacterized membrane protein